MFASPGNAARRAGPPPNLQNGYTTVTFQIGTITTGTVTPVIANGNVQTLTNAGTFTIKPPIVAPGQSAHFHLIIVNAASGANTITWDSSFNSASAGYSVSSYATTASKTFDAYIFVDNSSGAQWATVNVVGPR